MKVAVAGGTGLLGRAITTALLDAGHEVVVGSRSRPAKDPIDSRAQWVSVDVMAPATLPALLAGADAVVDAVQFPNSPIENPKKGYTFERIDLGGTRNLVDAAKAAGTPLFIGLSGVGAAEHAAYHWLRFKWQEEQHIAASGVPYVVFRPSWIYGPRDVSLNRFLGFAKFLPFVPVIGNGKTRINPLFIDDLAAHVVAALEKPEARGRIFEIGGPAVMTMDEVITTALRVAGKRRFLLHSPKPLMKLVASVAQYAPGRPLTRGAIDFITMDGIADTTALGEVFGLKLTPLEEGLATYLKR
ncbi:NAD-dependent epimerase/dehydratase family protein [Tepidiforma flava]|uniref:NAD-dependent epimerase/dehydratase family protein n=1 Tax=Tepidiforma flava TaxID=3004094 RepID=A0ABY7M5N3_9CHLR|nr:NAD-dependent epimerase/dehydratase family protein [Tepidiforma flava]WBL35819.1 NAD-dependent epimerase/dehydratase family protein [Tepidiforma flava]